MVPILGTMFLQNFVVNITNDYSGVEKEALMTLNISSNFAAANASINGDLPKQTNPVSTTFGYNPPIGLPLAVDMVSQVPVIQANLGYQGFANFTLSQTSNIVMGYSSDCSTGGGLGSKSCEASPNFATNYWNESYGSPV